MFNWTKDKVIQPPTTTKSKVKHIHPNLAWLCRQHGVLVLNLSIELPLPYFAAK
jgi:hypothetical protein